jgi:hypothetical protein
MVRADKKDTAQELKAGATHHNERAKHDDPTETEHRVSPLPEWMMILGQLAAEARAGSAASAKRLSLATKTC